MSKKMVKRGALRNSTEAAITCRPYSSTASSRLSDGIMRNFSRQGVYIETPRNYQSGTILVMRMVRYPAIPPSMVDEVRPRTICLAEVKWRRELAGESAVRYGFGLRYLD